VPKKIVVVDDELDILKVVSFRLEKAGYEILTAVDGPKALDLIRKEKPDLILLDIALPGMDGYEVCRKVKSDAALRNIPVIFLTASQVDRIKEKQSDSPADDFLIKPFEPEKLIAKIKKFIG